MAAVNVPPYGPAGCLVDLVACTAHAAARPGRRGRPREPTRVSFFRFHARSLVTGNRTWTRNPAVRRAVPAETLSFLQSRRARASRGGGGLVSLEHSARGRPSTLGNLLEPSGH